MIGRCHRLTGKDMSLRVWSADTDMKGDDADFNDRLLELTTEVNFARHLSLRAILIGCIE